MQNGQCFNRGYEIQHCTLGPGVHYGQERHLLSYQKRHKATIDFYPEIKKYMLYKQSTRKGRQVKVDVLRDNLIGQGKGGRRGERAFSFYFDRSKICAFLPLVGCCLDGKVLPRSQWRENRGSMMK